MKKPKATKKKVEAPRKGVNKKTAGKKGPRGTMTMIALLFITLFATAQQPNSTVPQTDYQLVNLPTSTAYTVVGITTYSKATNPYQADIKYLSSYLYLYADTNTVDTISTYRISQPNFLYGVNAYTSSVVGVPSSTIFSTGATIKCDSIYNTAGTSIDSFFVHVYKKSNILPRTVEVDASDRVNNGDNKQYARVVKITNPVPYPTY
jgi:hypothetical protein